MNKCGICGGQLDDYCNTAPVHRDCARGCISHEEAKKLREEVSRLRQWVNDLQSGMYVNCVYCGHRYGPADEVPASMADVLKEHIEQCPEHPMSKLKAELAEEVSRRYQAECNYDHAVKDRDSLRSQLAISQRRAKAAEDDLNGAQACFSCKHFRRNGGKCSGGGKCRTEGIKIFPCDEPGTYRAEIPDDGRDTYEWRGPVAGEVELVGIPIKNEEV